MSARPAKVASGLMKQMTPAITNSTPNNAHSQRHESATVASVSCWAPAKTNIRPMMIPIVVTDAWSNCSTTSAATIHATPTTSQTHQKRLTSCAAASACGTPTPGPKSGEAAELLI